MDRWVDVCIDGWRDGWMNREINGWMVFMLQDRINESRWKVENLEHTEVLRQ